MLIKVSVENFKSFDGREELSMISSSKIHAHKEHKVKIKQVNLLKNAVVYGANASGKSNLFRVFDFMKATVQQGLPINSVNDFCRSRIENEKRESVFELQFTVGDKFYAYGFSAILSERRITEEWLYALMQDGSARNLFFREYKSAPVLGEGLILSDIEKSRFQVYAEDFADNETQLFLTEMNRGKKYTPDSKLFFFNEVFLWLLNNIIILNPNIGISNTNAYYDQKSLERISELIRTFDTGVSKIVTRVISMEELTNMIPREILMDIFATFKHQMQLTNMPSMQTSLRIGEGFFNIRIVGNGEPEITVLVLKHGDSVEREIKFNIAINKYDNILLRSQEWNTRTYTSSYTTRVDQHSYNSSSLMKCSSENKVMLQSGGYGGSFAIRPAIWVDMLTSEEHAEIEKKEREQKAREEKERQERERLEQQRLALEKERREKGVCQHCGGDFKGLFIKKCAACGRRKDY